MAAPYHGTGTSDPDPEPTFHFDLDPDSEPTFHFDLDQNPDLNLVLTFNRPNRIKT